MLVIHTIPMSIGDTIINILGAAVEMWNSFFGKVLSALTTSPQDLYPGVWSIISTIFATTKSVGFALLPVFFYIGLAKNTLEIQELRRPEKTFGLFVRFAVAKVILDWTWDIITKISDIAQSLVTKIINDVGISTTSGNLPEIPDTIKNAVSGVSTIEGIGLLLFAAIGWLVITMCSIVVLLSVYARFFRIYLYTACAPIPLSSLAGQGTSRMATSFLRSYLAVCLQGMTIAVSCLIFSGVVSSSIDIANSSDAFVLLTQYIASMIFNIFILAALVKGADTVTRQMLGV